MVKVMRVYRHKKAGAVTIVGRETTVMGEIEEMTEFLTEHASDLIIVYFAKAEGFATEVTLQCEMHVAENTTKWLQEISSGKGTDGELHMLRAGTCPMEAM